MLDISVLLVVLLDLDELALVLHIKKEPHTIFKRDDDEFMFFAIYHTYRGAFKWMAPV
jgi:hypothetical protein